MPTYFHVSSVRNRDSIARYGLDWERMGAARGIAGSAGPELAGCFLCDPDEGDVDFFLGLNNTGGLVDVWRVDGVQPNELREMDGFMYIERSVPPALVSIALRDIERIERAPGWHKPIDDSLER